MVSSFVLPCFNYKIDTSNARNDRRLNEETKNQIIDLYKHEDKTQLEIADLINVSQSTVSRIVRAA